MPRITEHHLDPRDLNENGFILMPKTQDAGITTYKLDLGTNYDNVYKEADVSLQTKSSSNTATHSTYVTCKLYGFQLDDNSAEVLDGSFATIKLSVVMPQSMASKERARLASELVLDALSRRGDTPRTELASSVSTDAPLIENVRWDSAQF